MKIITCIHLFLLCSIFLVSLSGCEDKPKGAQTEKSDQFTLYIGIDKEGSVIWNWDGTLFINYQARGRLDWPGGITTSGSFGRVSNRDIVKFELTLDVIEKDNYVVKGTAVAKQAVSLVLLGTGDDNSDDTTIALVKGKNNIDFVGKLYATYSKE